MAASGRAVPLSLPLDSPNLRVLKALRTHQAQLQARLEALAKLQNQLEEVADKSQWDALVPVQGTSSLAYGTGAVVDTKTLTVNLGGGDEDGDSGYWVEYSVQQAQGVAQRKQEAVQAKLAKVQSAITDTEANLSKDMGFDGGSVNDKYEVLNEEGLPFVEIQEFEDDDGVPQAVSDSSASKSSLPQDAFATNPADISLYKPALQMPPIQANLIEKNQQSVLGALTAGNQAPSSASPKPPKRKSVSFTAETKPGPPEDEEAPLPIIGSEAAVASTSGSSRRSKAASSAAPVKDQITERPVKGSIIERDTTKPPPVLTAAERSTKSKSRFAEAGDFDGVASVHGEKVDLSAYLPRELRNVNASKNGKGKDRAEEEPDDVEEEEDEEDDDYEDEDDEDSDGLFQYSDSDEDDEDNLHIDDVMAMREAALEYHARRYNLGAGAGTGPLGGHGNPEDFDELGRLSAADKGGLPFVETYETTDGLRPPSKFRTGRLQTARMFIPDIPPVDISENIIPGDQDGPFEGKDGESMGADATSDFQGMSKEEIATFLRYVKALETGEELEDLHVVPAKKEDEQPKTDVGPMPPMVRETGKPSVKPTIVERGPTSMKPAAGVTQDNLVKEAASAPPKRVSRFRAARGE